MATRATQGSVGRQGPNAASRSVATEDSVCSCQVCSIDTCAAGLMRHSDARFSGAASVLILLVPHQPQDAVPYENAHGCDGADPWGALRGEVSWPWRGASTSLLLDICAGQAFAGSPLQHRLNERCQVDLLRTDGEGTVQALVLSWNAGGPEAAAHRITTPKRPPRPLSKHLSRPRCSTRGTAGCR